MEYSVFDAHCDTLLKILDEGASFEENRCEVDLKRMRSYKAYTQVMACFVAPEYKRTARQRTMSLIGAYGAVDEDSVKTILSIEGGEGIKTIADLLKYHSLGVKMAALTWNYSNHLAAGAHERDKTRGLTAFGKKVVGKMNEIHMLVDVSHLNDKSFYEVAELSNMPVIASHSCSRSVCNHVRNLTDDMFNIIVKSGGCVGINLYPVFLTKTKHAVIDDAVRHIEHFMSLGGENSIGIGSDFDGVDGCLPEGISGCGDLYKLFDRLLSLNYSEEQVNKISHRNFVRIFENI